MARMFISNDEKKYNYILGKNIQSGLSDYSEYHGKGIFLAAHKKRIVKITNYLKCGNGFCSLVGSCIYKGFIGKEALRLIYNDFNGDIEQIREKCIGNYLIAIFKDKILSVFVDKYQIYHAFYFNINGIWGISNSLANIGFALPDKTVNEFSLLQESFKSGTIGDETVFLHAQRIMGYHAIIIDFGTGEFEVRHLPYHREHWNFDKIEDAVVEYAEKVKSVCSSVVSAYGDKITINLTGGLDSRTVLAGFMSVGCKVNTIYGVGNSVVTGTEPGDLVICKEHAKKFALNFYQMDWKCDYLTNHINWDSMFKKYGFFYKFYGSNPAYYSEYEGKIPFYPCFMETGLFGEALRLRDWAQEQKEKIFSFNQFLDGYQFSSVYSNAFQNQTFYRKSLELKEYIKEKYLQLGNVYGIDLTKGVSKDRFEEIRYMHNRIPDSAKYNIYNEFCPSISLLGTYQLCELPFDVPAEFRANAKFQLMLMDKLYPSVLEIPFFSHLREQFFDRATFTLNPRYSTYEIMGEKLRNMGLRNTAFYEILRKTKNKLLCNNHNVKNYVSGINESKELIRYLSPIISEDAKAVGEFVQPENYSEYDSVVHLMYYALYLHGIRLILEDNQ